MQTAKVPLLLTIADIVRIVGKYNEEQTGYCRTEDMEQPVLWYEVGGEYDRPWLHLLDITEVPMTDDLREDASGGIDADTDQEWLRIYEDEYEDLELHSSRTNDGYDVRAILRDTYPAEADYIAALKALLRGVHNAPEPYIQAIDGYLDPSTRPGNYLHAIEDLVGAAFGPKVDDEFDGMTPEEALAVAKEWRVRCYGSNA